LLGKLGDTILQGQCCESGECRTNAEIKGYAGFDGIG
jgi:hypothetical protein